MAYLNAILHTICLDSVRKQLYTQQTKRRQNMLRNYPGMPKNPRNEKVMNRKSLTILTAVACLVIANYPAMAQELTPAQTQFSWDEWGVSIKGLSVTDRVPKTFGPETADGDSIFVVLNLVVQNNSHSGKAFIPQNDLKLVIG